MTAQTTVVNLNNEVTMAPAGLGVTAAQIILR